LSQIIVVALAICMLVTSMIFYFQIPQKLEARYRNKGDMENIATEILMLYSSEKYCIAKNITSGNFGANITQLNSLSNSNAIKLTYPSPGLAGGTISNGATLYHLQFTKVAFIQNASATKPQPASVPTLTGFKAYRADLQISAKEVGNVTGIPLPDIIVPFYLMADATGKFLSCRATNYPDYTNFSTRTIEDFMCDNSIKSAPGYTPAVPPLTYVFAPQVYSGNCVQAP
jgi:hypothetical protein